MRTINIGEVTVFDHPEATKEQALKILEEAAETVEAFKQWDKYHSYVDEGSLYNEIADTIQACANLIAALNKDDFTDVMGFCEQRNIERGRITVEEPEPELKPCPFCGGKAVFLNEKTICCENINCPIEPTLFSHNSKIENATAWNTRAGEEDE